MAALKTDPASRSAASFKVPQLSTSNPQRAK